MSLFVRLYPRPSKPPLSSNSIELPSDHQTIRAYYNWMSWRLAGKTVAVQPRRHSLNLRGPPASSTRSALEHCLTVDLKGSLLPPPTLIERGVSIIHPFSSHPPALASPRGKGRGWWRRALCIINREQTIIWQINYRLLVCHVNVIIRRLPAE